MIHTAPKKIAVVILNYNNWKDTIACAESVLASTMQASWIFVVDNHSTDDSAQKLMQWAKGQLESELSSFGVQKSKTKPLPYQEIFTTEKNIPAPSAQVIFIHSQHNKGYAAGNNHGMRAALHFGADAVWILNNDTMVEPDALGAMTERLFAKNRPGLCGSLVCYTDTGLVQCCGGGKTQPWTGLSTLYAHKQKREQALMHKQEEVEKQINFIYGASVMASREFIQTVGLMDERYFLYCEEQDWAYSAKGRFDLAYAPQAVVHHKEGSTTGFSGRKVSLRSLWYLTRSRILLTCKHKLWALPTVLFSIAFAALRMAWRRMA